MTLTEIERALSELRLSGIAATLNTRVMQAQSSQEPFKSNLRSDRDLILFSPQTNHTKEYQSVFVTEPVWLFWSASECDCCVHTCPNELQEGGKHSRLRFN